MTVQPAQSQRKKGRKKLFITTKAVLGIELL
jgi:hypothetical protein